MKAAYGVDSMPQTGENVAREWGISRTDQDAYALVSQQVAAAQVSIQMAAPLRSGIHSGCPAPESP